MGTTAISYATKAWNPMVGCPPPLVSEGCTRCWARELHDMRHRALLAGKRLPEMYRRPFSEIQGFPERWNEPATWRKPQRVFVGSQTDLFHPLMPASNVYSVLNLAGVVRRHLYLLLTKRPERMAIDLEGTQARGLEHVLLGTTICTQADADRAAPHLEALARRGWRLWLSLEPLLEPVDVRGLPAEWVVIGAEQAQRGQRPMSRQWALDIVNACRGRRVYVKQITRENGRGVCSEPEQFPDFLRFRELPDFPEVPHA